MYINNYTVLIVLMLIGFKKKERTIVEREKYHLCDYRRGININSLFKASQIGDYSPYNVFMNELYMYIIHNTIPWQSVL